MQKQQSVITSLGPLTVSCLTIGDLRDLDPVLARIAAEPDNKGFGKCVLYLPVISASLRKCHPELTPDQLEITLSVADFMALFFAVLEVSGLKQAPPGEPIPVPV